MNEKCELMQKIYEYGLKVVDLKLFIDTHPDSLEAIDMYNKTQKEYEDISNLYNLKYGEINALPWECECEV